VFRPCVDDAFEGGLFLENGLGFFRVVPELGLRGDRVKLFDSLLLGFDVKDASAKAPAVLPGGSILQRFLLTSELFLAPQLVQWISRFGSLGMVDYSLIMPRSQSRR
jgi:hypothetical protein